MTELKSKEEIFKFFEQNLIGQNEIVEQVNKIINKSNENTNNLTEYLQWISKNHDLKINSYPISPKIIPSNFSKYLFIYFVNFALNLCHYKNTDILSYSQVINCQIVKNGLFIFLCLIFLKKTYGIYERRK